MHNANIIPRAILHVDMDAFYASVEQLDRADLRGWPVIVGGDPAGRGVVSAASYEARPFGVHSAMPMATAVRLCPQATVLRPRMKRYVELSRRIRTILGDYTPLIEALSIDEAFLDVTGSQRLLGAAEKIAADIKRRLRDQVQLTASIGVAPNKFLAKLASDLQKPDGLVIVPADRIEAFLEPLAVEKLWGVGRATLRQLHERSVRTVGDLTRWSVDQLAERLGTWGEQLYRLSRGIDDRAVVTDSVAKSVGTETTFASDVSDREQLRDVLLGQVDEVGWRLRGDDLEAATLTIKIRYPDFRTITRAAALGPPANLFGDLWAVGRQLFEQHLGGDRRAIRLLGATASNLRPAGSGQQLLFEPADRQKKQSAERAADQIRRRFGYDAIGRGGG